MVSRAAAELLSQEPGGSTMVSLPRGDNGRQKNAATKNPPATWATATGGRWCVEHRGPARRKGDFGHSGSTGVSLPRGERERQKNARRNKNGWPGKDFGGQPFYGCVVQLEAGDN